MAEKIPSKCPWCRSPIARGGGEYRCGSYHHRLGHIEQTQNCMNMAEHAATIAEIRAILAVAVREIVDRGFVTADGTNLLRLPRDQCKRLRELLGGDNG